MPKLIEYSGLPASGKTTAAKAQVIAEGNTLRVNRDDLRNMLFDGRWSGSREKLVVQIEKAVARQALEDGHNVIVDDTNLRGSSMWKDFAREQKADHELKFLPCGVGECITRDALREKPVGSNVIRRMALRAGLLDLHKDDKPIVIFDIDGTLADLTHRLPFIKNGNKDYDAFYSNRQVMADAPIRDVIDKANQEAEDKHVLLFSGRPDRTCFATQQWLRKQEVKYSHLFMRFDRDRRPDYMTKSDMLKELLAHVAKERILYVVDDRLQVIRNVWEHNGIPVIPVGAAAKGVEF